MATQRIEAKIVHFPSETLATEADAKRYCSLINQRRPRIRLNDQWYRVVSASLDGDENQGQISVVLESRIPPVRCEVCGETLFDKSEKACGKHHTIEGCNAAIIRHTERVLVKGSEKAQQRLHHAQEIMDEILADVQKIEVLLKETIVT
jgi:hypothetical protein